MADESKSSACENFYSIEAPGVIRSNSIYNAAVTILQAKEPCSISLKLRGDTYSAEKTLEVQPLTTSIVTFDVTELQSGDYFFEASSDGALKLDRKIKLIFEENKPLIFLQLDKQLYKRGDKVDFRVLFLDSNTRPADISKPIKVTIEQNQEVIAEFKNVEVIKGIYTEQWSIPEDAASGTYLIRVHISENARATKSFEISNFKEPKFNIAIKSPLEVRYENEYVKLAIEAKHSDGTPVKGRCTLLVKSVGGYFGLRRPIEKHMDIDGTVENIIFNIVNDFKIEQSFITEVYFDTATLSVEITVVDEVNNVTETLIELLKITQDGKGSRGAGCGSCCGWNCDDSDFPREDSGKAIVIEKLNKKPKVGDTLLFDVLLNKPTKYFVYVLTARGNIEKSELVNLEEGSTKSTISFNADFQCVPRAFLLAYYVFEGELFFDEIGFNLEHEFGNKLTVKAPSSNEAGKDITIEITSDPNSIVGIMAIDVNAKLAEHKNDLNAKDIFDALSKIYSQTPRLDGYGEYPGMRSGLVTFTNVKWEGFVEGDPEGFMQNMCDREHMRFINKMPRMDPRREEKIVQRQILERTQMLGNLMFVNKETDAQGNLTLNETLPDKATTWLLSVFAVHPKSGFAMLKTPLEIEAKSAASGAIDEVNSGAAIKIVSKTKEFNADLYEQSEFTGILDVAPPEGIIPLAVEFTVERNLLSSMIAHLAKFPEIMYCTGMLHMTTFLPNVVALEFLQTQNKLDTDLAKNIIAKFDEAIARELAERREDGSFGWFTSDTEGSPHVTAVIMRSFQRVSKFVEIDSKVIQEGLDYLVTRQTESGDFKREPEPYQAPFQADLNVGLTATILLAFIQKAENIAKYQGTIDRAIEYIVSNLPAVKCGYDLALSFYVMQKLQHPVALELKERLLSTARLDASKNLKWWTYSNEDSADPDYYAPTSDLEVTSYVLLGLLETEPVESLVPIIKWLLPYDNDALQHRPESMDPAISLEAILSFAVRSGSSSGVTNIEFTAFGEKEYKGTVRIEPKTSKLVKTFVLPCQTKKISYTTKDKGSFKGNLTYYYVEN